MRQKLLPALVLCFALTFVARGGDMGNPGSPAPPDSTTATQVVALPQEAPPAPAPQPLVEIVTFVVTALASLL